MIGCRFVMIELKIQKDLTEEYPRAILFRDDVRMFSDPPDPGALGPRLFHHGCGIDTRLAGRSGKLRDDPIEEGSKLFFDDIVIIVSPRVARDLAGCGSGFMYERRVVIDGDRDHRSRIRKYQPRIRTLLRLAREPRHLAVKAAAQPFVETRGVIRQHPGTRETDLVESELACFVFDPVGNRDHALIIEQTVAEGDEGTQLR